MEAWGGDGGPGTLAAGVPVHDDARRYGRKLGRMVAHGIGRRRPDSGAQQPEATEAVGQGRWERRRGGET
jgi:hypothetical protein